MHTGWVRRQLRAQGLKLQGRPVLTVQRGVAGAALPSGTLAADRGNLAHAGGLSDETVQRACAVGTDGSLAVVSLDVGLPLPVLRPGSLRSVHCLARLGHELYAFGERLWRVDLSTAFPKPVRLRPLDSRALTMEAAVGMGTSVFTVDSSGVVWRVTRQGRARSIGKVPTGASGDSLVRGREGGPAGASAVAPGGGWSGVEEGPRFALTAAGGVLYVGVDARVWRVAAPETAPQWSEVTQEPLPRPCEALVSLGSLLAASLVDDVGQGSAGGGGEQPLDAESEDRLPRGRRAAREALLCRRADAGLIVGPDALLEGCTSLVATEGTLLAWGKSGRVVCLQGGPTMSPGVAVLDGMERVAAVAFARGVRRQATAQAMWGTGVVTLLQALRRARQWLLGWE